MTRVEATDFIRPAVDGTAPRWADLGAGEGVFTAALAALLGAGGHVLALERDRKSLRALREVAARRSPADAPIDVVAADLADLDAIPEFTGARWGGVLLANVLHYFDDPAPVVETVARQLEAGGRIAIVEYDRVTSNPWVPHPLPVDGLARLAARLALPRPRELERRGSRYGSTLYLAAIDLGS